MRNVDCFLRKRPRREGSETFFALCRPSHPTTRSPLLMGREGELVRRARMSHDQVLAPVKEGKTRSCLEGVRDGWEGEEAACRAGCLEYLKVAALQKRLPSVGGGPVSTPGRSGGRGPVTIPAIAQEVVPGLGLMLQKSPSSSAVVSFCQEDVQGIKSLEL